MRLMRRTFVALATVALLASGVVAPAGAADKCASNVVVFSYVRQGTGSVNPNAVGCLSPEDYNAAPVDGRLIYPRSVQIQVRFSDGFDYGNQLTADLDGLGFTPSPTITGRVKLIKGLTATGGIVYDSAALPLGAGVAGCVEASVYPNADDLETPEDERFIPMDVTNYHTVDPTNLENPCGDL